MKSKKWIVLITLTISVLSLFFVFFIGKERNSIYYDIFMAFLGSAVLGLIISSIEYFVERRKAMEDFLKQGKKVLKELRRIKHIDIDAPMDIVTEVFKEESSNKFKKDFMDSNDKEMIYDAKNELINWLRNNFYSSFDSGTINDNTLEHQYNSKIQYYKSIFKKSIYAYCSVSLISLDELNNAYRNLDFIFGNISIRQNAYDSIFLKLHNSINLIKEEVYHFTLLKNGKGNFSVCALKVLELNNKFFVTKEEKKDNVAIELIFQSVFDEIDDSLEKFRCKIYMDKYKKMTYNPVTVKINTEKKSSSN